MKACGIIVEYNPFHNGHYYHLQESKKITNSDIIIAVMSGNFLQRGEPALVSKWTRTKMALANGADLVIELPYVFATQKADIFATGSVSILHEIGADTLCFGSESGDIDIIEKTITFLKDNEKEYNQNIKQFLQKGNSYPKSASLAFEQMEFHHSLLDLSSPNNILGFHYVKAIKNGKMAIKPYTIQRKNANYHDESFQSETIASATSIRKRLEMMDGYDFDSISPVVPKETLHQLQNYYTENSNFHNWEMYYPYLQYKILTSTKEELHEIYEAEEGLENRLLQAARISNSFHSFMNQIKTKRYTWTRLQRLCVHILNNVKKSDMQKLDLTKSNYIRVLGMNRLGQNYLNERKKSIEIPLITTVSKWEDLMLTIDLQASTTYALGFPKKIRPDRIKEEFSTPPIQK